MSKLDLTFPAPHTDAEATAYPWNESGQPGLTIREHIAIQAFAALIPCMGHEQAASIAVKGADALLDALNRNT